MILEPIAPSASPCERAGCQEPAEYRVFWPGELPATVCTGHLLMTLNAGQQAGVRVTSVALGSMFEDLLLWRMVRGNERVDSGER